MKKLILLLLLSPILTHAQKHCCSMSSTEKFAQVASSESFAMAHLAPAPLDYSAEKGSMIKFDCGDGKKANAFFVPTPKPSNNWLFVYHEWWGLNDYIKRVSENFSDELPGVNILAIDLYDGQLALTADSAQAIMQRVSDQRARAIIKGAIKHAGPNAKIGTVGWCFGGGWSLQSAIMEGKQAVACVIYYGMPETEIQQLKKLNTDVYGVFASKDDWITPEVVSTFEKNMDMVGKKFEYKSYDAVHAFANPSNPKHDAKSADDAHNYVLKYLREKYQ